MEKDNKELLGLVPVGATKEEIDHWIEEIWNKAQAGRDKKMGTKQDAGVKGVGDLVPEPNNKTTSSRRLARTWPYARYARYEQDLRKAAAAWFQRKGFTVHHKMPYCLDKHVNWKNNIICADVVDYIETQRTISKSLEPYPLHKYIHHGLSSQAMLFNLIGPLIVRDDLSVLENAFRNAGIGWPQGRIEARFEVSDRTVFNENTGQPTSIDLIITGLDKTLYIESKLSEKGFGGCTVFASGDCEGRNPCGIGFTSCYLHHIGRQYWNHLERHGFVQNCFKESPICPLANYYQFFREVIFALHNKGEFVLLYDARNPAFLRQSAEDAETMGLWPFLMQFVPEQFRKGVGAISLQQVVDAIEENGHHADWINEFRVKYGLYKDHNPAQGVT